MILTFLFLTFPPSLPHSPFSSFIYSYFLSYPLTFSLSSLLFPVPYPLFSSLPPSLLLSSPSPHFFLRLSLSLSSSHPVFPPSFFFFFASFSSLSSVRPPRPHQHKSVRQAAGGSRDHRGSGTSPPYWHTRGSIRRCGTRTHPRLGQQQEEENKK